MDDTNKLSNTQIRSDPMQQVDDSVPPVVSSPTSSPSFTPEVIGGMNKEAGPQASVEMPLAEVLQPSEKAPELPPEVVEAGVEVSKNPEVPDLTLHDKNAGISHAPVIAPLPTEPTGLVDIDTTPEEALAATKVDKNPKNSKSWLAIEVLKMVQKRLLGGDH